MKLETSTKSLKTLSRKGTREVLFYYSAMFIVSLYAVYKGLTNLQSVDIIFVQFSLGLLVSLLTIPLHEYIHFIGFKVCGKIPHVKYDICNLSLYTFTKEKLLLSQYKFILILPFCLIFAVYMGLLLKMNEFVILVAIIGHMLLCLSDIVLFVKSKEWQTHYKCIRFLPETEELILT